MEVVEVTELPQMSELVELPTEDTVEPATSNKKRNREEQSHIGFGELIEDEGEDKLKVAKYEEGETPKRATGEPKEEENGNEALSVPKKSLLQSGIFDTGDDGDYENEADRERRLSYLTAMGAKQKKADRLDEKVSFSAAMPSRKKSSHGASASSSLRTPYGEFKSPSKSQPRTKMEKKEFVKDSVQSKIVRETAPHIKPATSKSLDFDALMQRIAQRQTQIKLPTAEQVGLPSVVNPDLDIEDVDGEEVSLEEESDEISLEIDEEEAVGPEKPSTGPTSSSSSMPPPGINIFQKRGKTLDMEEDEPVEVKELIVQAKSSNALPTEDTEQALLLDLEDGERKEESLQSHLEAPVLTQMAVSEEKESAKDRPNAPSSGTITTATLPVEPSSSVSTSSSSLHLEYPPTLPINTDTPASMVTPGGAKLKALSDGTSKPSLLSTWLANPPPSAKRGSSTTSKTNGRAAKSTSSIPVSSMSSKSATTSIPIPSSKPSSSSSGIPVSLTSKRLFKAADDSDNANDILFESENAMMSASDGSIGVGPKSTLGGIKIQKKGTPKATMASKAKQLFSDEADTGFGSDADQVEARERQAASSDESEGGQSQDAYENEFGDDGGGSGNRFAGDIFESDDRAVIRSLQMKQEMEREAAEAREMEQMILRRERRDRRIALELQSEARALREAQQMEERLAQRRAQRGAKKGDLGGSILESSASMPTLPGRHSTGGSDWLLDDSDEDDEVEVVQTGNGSSVSSKPKHLLLAAKRFEALTEQQQRRRLASSSQYLIQDEDSQSILQVIDRANTQHSRMSSDHDGIDSPYASLSNLGDIIHKDVEASQDSLGGWFDRPALALSSFSASSTEHLVKLKAHFKGNATQLQSSALLFQRSQDGFENSQDGFDSKSSASPLSRSKSSLPAPKPK